jgi:hypothetical protein
MTDDMERLLKRFRPAGPRESLRETILRADNPLAGPARRWPLWVFRGAIAALLLVSVALYHAGESLNRDSAARIGLGLPRWTAEAQQAADLIGSGPAGRQYIEICLMASKARSSRSLAAQGVEQ